jgi:hypothetical protein
MRALIPPIFPIEPIAKSFRSNRSFRSRPIVPIKSDHSDPDPSDPSDPSDTADPNKDVGNRHRAALGQRPEMVTESGSRLLALIRPILKIWLSRGQPFTLRGLGYGLLRKLLLSLHFRQIVVILGHFGFNKYGDF